MHFTTKDHPEANKRQPLTGEQAWTFRFPLADGNELHVHMGKECRDTFRGFVLNEELDDAADEAGVTL